MEPIVAVRGLGKRYQIQVGEKKRYRTLRDDLADNVRKLIKGQIGRSRTEDFWALKDIDLDIFPGEVVGIIGRNGAGKSTLLKILSRVVQPTRGEAIFYGRIASLLEVGTGFHPELTGRENIFMSGAVLGMKRAEIKRKFDEIVAFAEVEKFLDTPVKRYSSGMYVRLAFAVAAHLEPEVLLVDEVLAVGDAAFQKKCLGKMEDVATQQGRTVLFVSHNMTALQSLCKRAIWLDQGRLVDDGSAGQVISQYLQIASESVLEQVWDDPTTAPGNERVRLRRAALTPQLEDERCEITVRTPLKVEFEYWNFVPQTELNLSLHLYNAEGICVFNSASAAKVYPSGLIQGICHIPGQLLNDGNYRVMIMIVKDKSIALYSHHDVLEFEVHDVEREGWLGKWQGVVRPNLAWHMKTVKEISP